MVPIPVLVARNIVQPDSLHESAIELHVDAYAAPSELLARVAQHDFTRVHSGPASQAAVVLPLSSSPDGAPVSGTQTGQFSIEHPTTEIKLHAASGDLHMLFTQV